MAEVWLAERADGAFKREVALKLPMLSRLRKDLASRFARERDILAGLEHPNIARMYEAGVSGEGLPYLAMEYVHGEPLTTWCDRHQLGIRERLKLFLQVLDAVQYAHGHQVIHRDIKPSNILVTDSGQVRLLDFGVAKLLAREDEQTELTQLYGRALTPEYASPELVRGDGIEQASDVYSLGVVLYELLCGSRPYRLKAVPRWRCWSRPLPPPRWSRPARGLGLRRAANGAPRRASWRGV
jgi:serine/threonine-protein kinase